MINYITIIIVVTALTVTTSSASERYGCSVYSSNLARRDSEEAAHVYYLERSIDRYRAFNHKYGQRYASPGRSN